MHQVHDPLGQDQLHGVHHLAAGNHHGIEAGNLRALDQPLEVDFVLHAGLVLEEMDQHQALIRGGNIFDAEGIGGIGQGDALKVDVRLGELGQDVMHVVVHAAMDGVHHIRGLIPALRLIAVDLLYPLQVDGGADADEQVDLGGEVDIPRDHATMEPLVKEQIGIRRDRLPVGEGPRRRAIEGCLLLVVDIVAAFPHPGLAVGAKEFQLLIEEIALGSEVAQVAALFQGLLYFPPHLLTVVAMETVPLDEGRAGANPLEDMLQGILDGTGAGAGGTGHGNDGVFSRHTEASYCVGAIHPWLNDNRGRWLSPPPPVHREGCLIELFNQILMLHSNIRTIS